MGVDEGGASVQLKLVSSSTVASKPALVGTVSKPSQLELAVESNPVKFRLRIVEEALGKEGADVLGSETSVPKSMLLLLVQ